MDVPVVTADREKVNSEFKSETAQPHACWSDGSKAECAFPINMHTNTFIKHMCVHTAGHADLTDRSSVSVQTVQMAFPCYPLQLTRTTIHQC